MVTKMVKRSAEQAQLDLTLALMYLNRFRERLPKSWGDVKGTLSVMERL